MLNKKVVARIITFLWCCLTGYPGNAASNDGLGQVIQIQTRFGYLRGRGNFLIVIRDIDHQQNIPYLFDITQPNNLWLIFTHSRHYLITASRLQWIRYKPCCNQYKPTRTYNFCHLESNGRIIRGQSMKVLITGDLSPYPDTYSCQVNLFPEGDFTIVTQKVC